MPLIDTDRFSMPLSEFIANYPVKLASAEATPLMMKIKWRLNTLVQRREGHFAPPYPVVSLSCWRPESESFVNFGDELARVVVELILAKRGATLLDEVASANKLLTIGSALHRAADGTVIWGTGLHGASLDHDHAYTSLDVRAVRGPLTAKFLRQRGIDVPAVYGDPAFLLPHIDCGRYRPTGKYPVGIVPNLYDMRFVEQTRVAEKFPELRIIDPRRAWNTVVADIMDHAFIIASSLHGLVIADAYGIPSRYVRLTEKENILKYHDYYLGTGRMLQPARSIAEALAISDVEPFEFDYKPLLNAFPWDLWGL